MKKKILAGILMLMLCLCTVMVSAQEEETDSRTAGKTYNILLIGVDRRDDSWNGNSDVMMLVTVNYEKQTIFLTSFLRDLYADIPGIGVHKLNASCANGGAALCVETIRSNYQVEIDNYAMVDFNSMRHIVDALGGVDIEINEDERTVANSYIATMCEADGEPTENHLIQSAGLVHMDGYQAVGYARNRYSGGENDFGRTGRQREIIKKLFEKVETIDAKQLMEALLNVFPYVDSDLDPLALMAMMPDLVKIKDFGMQEQHIPYDDEYYVQNEILIPTDMEATISKLRETIY